MFKFKFSFLIVALGFSMGAGANTGLTAQDLSGLYSSSFPGANTQQMNQMGSVSSISEIYALMNALQMNGGGSASPMPNPQLEMNFLLPLLMSQQSNPMLMQNTNSFGGGMGIDPTWLQMTGAVK
jgi:hypothetical protein